VRATIAQNRDFGTPSSGGPDPADLSVALGVAHPASGWLRCHNLVASCSPAGFLPRGFHPMPPSCEVIPSYEHSCPVLHIKGEFTQDMEKDLEQHYLSIPEGKRSRVVLDFSETRYINSSGIAILIALITRATDEASSLEFAGLSSHFKKVMEIVGLDDFVQMHENLSDAFPSGF
tara:strand:- start:12310 stop:12834 length:525 start_codon:yes stop_codon:yes gene_type:complete